MSQAVFIPADILKPFVKSFVISTSDQAADYIVLPGTSIVMGFQFSGRISYSNDDQIIPLSSAGITGLRDTYRRFNNVENTHSILIMFSETGAAAFFNTPMHEIFGESLSLDDLMLRSQMDVIAEKINTAKNNLDRIAIVEDFLVSRLNNKVNDDLVNLAVSIIKQHRGNIKINLLAEKLHISQSQLEKRFRKMVGATPKKFASIVRLRSVIDFPIRETSFTRLGLEAGYFDQAHFIKDFKSFTGQTPEQFFGKK